MEYPGINLQPSGWETGGSEVWQEPDNECNDVLPKLFV